MRDSAFKPLGFAWLSTVRDNYLPSWFAGAVPCGGITHSIILALALAGAVSTVGTLRAVVMATTRYEKEK